MAVVFLTFDDGPLSGTDDVIAVLNARQAKGTLFMVGDHVTTQWRRARLDDAHASRFIQVANHSTTHADHQYSAYYANPSAVVDGFSRATRTLRITTQPVDARLPGRNTWRAGSIVQTASDSGPAADRLAGIGYRIFGWDVEWRMASGRPAEQPAQVLAKVERSLQSGTTKRPNKVVLLAHDVMFRASVGGRSRLEQFIGLLQNAHHSFEFIANYAP